MPVYLDQYFFGNFTPYNMTLCWAYRNDQMVFLMLYCLFAFLPLPMQEWNQNWSEYYEDESEYKPHQNIIHFHVV